MHVLNNIYIGTLHKKATIIDLFSTHELNRIVLLLFENVVTSKLLPIKKPFLHSIFKIFILRFISH